MAQDTGIPAHGIRIALTAPVRPGPVPALVRGDHAQRAGQVFEVLAAGWSGYQGRPWSGSYAGRVGQVPGLRSLRLARVEQPAAIALEASFDAGPGTTPADALRALAPVLDLVFASCEGYPGARASGFGQWLQDAQAGAGGPPASRAELTIPPAGHAQVAASPADVALALHAAADMQRLVPLFAAPQDAAVLQAATGFLLPSVAAQVAGAGAELQALKNHFSDAVHWLQGHAAGASSAFHTAFAASDAAGAGTAAAGPALVPVNGKQLVMQVLLDAGNTASVCGYAERMKASMGLIFLGLDKTDPQYALQSDAVNRAIGTISEEEAFTRALAATRDVLQPLSGAASVDLGAVTTKVLAALCTLWFDIPDGRHFIASGIPLPPPVPTTLLPACCPGQFAPLSGSIFQPEPGALMTALGVGDGKQLRLQARQFVTAQRTTGRPPKGVLAQALFEAFPNSPEQDDLLARTLIGVMMGFLPTAQGNMANVFAAWHGGAMATLSQALLAQPELDLYQRAKAIVEPPMIAAIQGNPVPPAIWRTATQDQVIGGQQVRKDDKLSINIASAMKEDLQAGISDVTPVFGGDRDLDPHPTHACPGRWMGMGVMLGVVTGVLEALPGLPPLKANLLSAVF
jgi:hypothetical protein